jgi:hypothetical protein
MSVEFAGTLFSGSERNGASLLVGVGHADRYEPITLTELQSSGLFENVNSAEIVTSDEADGNIVLFQNAIVPYLSFTRVPDFQGEFLQLSLSEVDAGGIDDKGWSFRWPTDSVLAVAGRRKGTNETRLSFSDIFLSQWNTFLDEMLAGSRAHRQGDPTLTWEMFPVGVSFLDSDGTYLKIVQQLHINMPWPFADYAASMTYHIGLFVDGNQHVRAWGQRWAWWVESGIKAGHIGESLGPQVTAGLDTLVNQVNDQLATLDGFLGKVTDVYYLPGRQTSLIATGSFVDSTFHDVTIVVEH